MLCKIRGRSPFSPMTLLWLARARFIRIFAITFEPSRAFLPNFFRAIFGLFSLIFWKKIKNKNRVLKFKIKIHINLKFKYKIVFLPRDVNLSFIQDVIFVKNNPHTNIAALAYWLRCPLEFCLSQRQRRFESRQRQFFFYIFLHFFTFLIYNFNSSISI